MSVVLGGRECVDAFHLISALSFYVCCFGGKGMRRCIPFHFCSVFLCLLFWGGRECADAFRLISALSFYVCCFGGKGMRSCIPFDFCSVFLCRLFWGEGNAQLD